MKEDYSGWENTGHYRYTAGPLTVCLRACLLSRFRQIFERFFVRRVFARIEALRADQWKGRDP